MFIWEKGVYTCIEIYMHSISIIVYVFIFGRGLKTVSEALETKFLARGQKFHQMYENVFHFLTANYLSPGPSL